MVEPIGSLLGPRNPRNKDWKSFLGPRNPRSQQQTEQTADYLVEKFHSPEFRPFFLKVAWRLDKGTIDRLAATSLELGKNPRSYFIVLVRREKSWRE